MNIQNQHLIEKEILLNDRKSFSIVSGSILERCRVVSAVPATSMSFDGSTLLHCDFTTKTQLKGMGWNRTNLKNVTFHGKYIENEFGALADTPTEMRCCDFTAAHLDGCMFYQCELDTLTFPKWPYFVVKSPVENSAEMARQSPSPALETLCESFELLHHEVTAVVYYVPTLRKLIPADEEAMKEFFPSFSNVI